jgi:hypothetical protein
MEKRLEAVRKSGTTVEYRKYKNLGHGFGLGKGTTAEGWVFEAVRFWQPSPKASGSSTRRTLSPPIRLREPSRSESVNPRT